MLNLQPWRMGSVNTESRNPAAVSREPGTGGPLSWEPVRFIPVSLSPRHLSESLLQKRREERGEGRGPPAWDGLRGAWSGGGLRGGSGQRGWLRAWSCQRRSLGTGEGAETGAGAEVGSGAVRSPDILRGRPAGPSGALRGEPAGAKGLEGVGRQSPRRGRAERAPWRCTSALPGLGSPPSSPI